MEMDDGLVGIENKFNAGFQTGQPKKYLNTLSKLATARAEGGAITKDRYLLLILAPADRKSEINKKIADLSKDQQEHCRFLSWEEMLETLTKVSLTQDTKTKEVILDFSAYVNRYLKQSLFNQNRRWLESLSQWKPYGSERQQSVTSDLWEFFPGASPRPSQGKTWRGYYFPGGWFGFVEKSRISNKYQAEATRNDAELVIVLNINTVSNPDPDPSIFHRISMVDNDFSGALEKAAYVVNIMAMTSREKWVDALCPFIVKETDTPLV